MLRVIFETIGTYINGGSPDILMTILLVVGLLILTCIGLVSAHLMALAWHAAGGPGNMDLESCVIYPAWCFGSLWLFCAAFTGLWLAFAALFLSAFLVSLWIDAITYNLQRDTL